MIGKEEAIQRGIDANAMLYDKGRKDSTQLGYVYDLALQAPDGPTIEIGVFHGGSFVTWACAREGRGQIYAADNWASKNMLVFEETLKRYGLKDNVKIITARSYDVPKQTRGTQFAFCFIDAAHDWTGIPRDMLVWPQRIMPQGILALHDYGVPAYKIRVVVKAIADSWNAIALWPIMGQVGSTMAYKNPQVRITPKALLDKYNITPGCKTALAKSEFIGKQILPYQAAAIYSLFKPFNKAGAKILEIGTRLGYSASIIAQACPLAQITTIDSSPVAVKRAIANLKQFTNVTCEYGVSWELLEKKNPSGFAAIFVDGDHRYALKDAPWYNQLMKGGMILFHDYSPYGSMPVVDALYDMSITLERPNDIEVLDTDGIGMAGFYRIGRSYR